MKEIILFTFLMSSAFSFSQITTTKVAPKNEQIDNIPYDSTLNFLGIEANKYLGQELYLNGKAESLRQYGYKGFFTNLNEDVYKCCKYCASYHSKYDDLKGKYFKVLDIIKDPLSSENDYSNNIQYYLKLEEKDSKDTIYYKYQSKYENFFPFIVVGFFEKQKSLLLNKEFIFTDLILQGSTDIETGKEITINTGQIWKCIDLTIEEKYYNLSIVIQNSLNQKTTIALSAIYNQEYKEAYLITEANKYKKKFGNENFNQILKREVKIGMTKEMCNLSWGIPNSINETITTGKKTEQWVYEKNYLYFNNGILTAIQ